MRIMTSGCQSNIAPLFFLIVVVFALTVSCYGAGLFKLLTAVWKGKGTASWGAFGPWWAASLCQLPRLGFISRFSSTNITLNGEAICWQRPTPALFQLRGIKHCRYARHRVFIEREGKGREKVVYKALASPSPLWKPASFLFENNCKTKESGSLANVRVFGNDVISFFFLQNCDKY